MNQISIKMEGNRLIEKTFKNMSEKIKENKFIAIGASAAAILVLLFSLSFVKDARAEKMAEEKAANEAATLAEVEAVYAEVEALYTDETLTMLADGVTIEQITPIEEEIASLEEDEYLTTESGALLTGASTELEYTKMMVDLRDSATALLKDGVLVQGADIAAVEAKATELNAFKPEYVASIMPTITEAKNQKASIDNATKLVNSLFTAEDRKEVRDDVTRSQYNEAKDAVAKIKDPTIKKQLEDALIPVDEFLKEKEAEAEAQAEATAQAYEAERKAKEKEEKGDDDAAPPKVAKPNPKGGDAVSDITFTSDGVKVNGKTASGTINVLVVDSNGNVVTSTSVKPNSSGNYTATLKLSNLPNGSYEIVTQNAKGTYSMINELDEAYQVVRAKVGDKLITFSYPNNKVCFKVENFAYQYDVNINVGHGGSDPGAPAYDKSIYEETVNLQVSLYEKQRYEDLGMKVHINRTGDTYGEMYGPSDLSNLHRSAQSHGYYGSVSKISYSNHHNASSNTKTGGIEVLAHASATSSELAPEKEILSYVSKLYPHKNHPYDMYTKDYDTNKLYDKSGGQVYSFKENYAMNRIPKDLFNVKTVIWEGAYLSNSKEFEWYWTEENWKVVSEYKIKVYAEYCGYDYSPPMEAPPAGGAWPTATVMED